MLKLSNSYTQEYTITMDFDNASGEFILSEDDCLVLGVMPNRTRWALTESNSLFDKIQFSRFVVESTWDNSLKTTGPKHAQYRELYERYTISLDHITDVFCQYVTIDDTDIYRAIYDA